ncbi:hypothetical protein GGI43DRAFT_399979 [Trichoderma evansii]
MSKSLSAVKQWLWEHIPSPMDIARYLLTLLPLPLWILSYELSWLMPDLIAGLNVGLVVIPQSLAFGTLARLSPTRLWPVF